MSWIVELDNWVGWLSWIVATYCTTKKSCNVCIISIHTCIIYLCFYMLVILLRVNVVSELWAINRFTALQRMLDRFLLNVFKQSALCFERLKYRNNKVCMTYGIWDGVVRLHHICWNFSEFIANSMLLTAFSCFVFCS